MRVNCSEQREPGCKHRPTPAGEAESGPRGGRPQALPQQAPPGRKNLGGFRWERHRDSNCSCSTCIPCSCPSRLLSPDGAVLGRSAGSRTGPILHCPAHEQPAWARLTRVPWAGSTLWSHGDLRALSVGDQAAWLQGLLLLHHQRCDFTSPAESFEPSLHPTGRFLLADSSHSRAFCESTKPMGRGASTNKEK